MLGLTANDAEHHYKSALVAKQQLEDVGFKIDLQVLDFATLVQRWTKPELFNVFSNTFPFPEVIDPATGAPLPEGETGELVLTCVTKQALPLVRGDPSLAARSRPATRQHVMVGQACHVRRVARMISPPCARGATRSVRRTPAC